MELREKLSKKRKPRTENDKNDFEYIIVIIIPLICLHKDVASKPTYRNSTRNS